MSKDYYAILGVSKSASQDEVKRAYRKLAHQYHPDKTGGDEKKFKEINEAYQILGDDRKRQQYDQFGTQFSGQAGSGGFGGFDFSGFDDIFEDIFSARGGPTSGWEDFFGGFGGGMGRRQRRGSDISIVLDAPFSESIFGARRSVLLQRAALCDLCGGSGAAPDAKIEKCETCQGTGTVREARRSILGTFTSLTECSKCKGRGEIPQKQCSVCRGLGAHRKQQNIEITIPAGIRDGEAIKFSGLGEQIPHAQAGDLYVRVRVMPHTFFSREGFDLVANIELPVTKLLLGGEEEIETLEGKIVLKIPELSKSGDILRMRQKGVPKPRGGRGDLLIRIIAKNPRKLSSNARRILSELEKEGL